MNFFSPKKLEEPIDELDPFAPKIELKEDKENIKKSKAALKIEK